MERPIADATAALVRLDERIAQSPVGTGWIERSHFTDACASLWVGGELVHMEDLVLRDASADIRTPTHELTIAHEVLRTRRRIASQPSDWALSDPGLKSLTGRAGEGLTGLEQVEVQSVEDDGISDGDLRFDDELAAVDAVLARSTALLDAAISSSPQTWPERDALVYDPDWNEGERLAEWRSVLAQTRDMPAVLRAAVMLDAWNTIEVLQRAPWLGRLLAASNLFAAGTTRRGHLTAFNLGLKAIPREQRASRNSEARIRAHLHALTIAAEIGMKEHDRLLLARQIMERKVARRRRSSKLPELVDLVLSRPMLSGEMIAEALSIAPQSARLLVQEMGLREMTGRERFRMWGVL